MIIHSRLFRALSLSLVICPVLSSQSSKRLPLGAQTAVCPVQLRSLEIHGDRLIFDYRNSSDKEIQGMLFGLAYYDSVQEPHRVAVLGGDNRHLRPGQLRRSGYSIKYWHHAGIEGWTLWPSKILFRDGTNWQMGHQSTACSIARWFDKQVTAPALPASVLTMPAEPPIPR